MIILTNMEFYTFADISLQVAFTQVLKNAFEDIQKCPSDDVVLFI